MMPDSRARVLVVGSGAREHALVWALVRSPRIQRVYCAPGNAGTALIATNLPIAVTDIAGVVRAAREISVDLVVVGPEVPLALGLVDALLAVGIRAFGPTQAAARIESSKVFSKLLMREEGIPTPVSRIFDDVQAARASLRQMDLPLVVKADGLAAGKGVLICHTRTEAAAAITQLMEQRIYGAAGTQILIEECVSGQEISLLALTDGEAVIPLLPARDYKRLLDDDGGPNTGGMGSFAPAHDILTPDEISAAVRTILLPAVQGLRTRGHPFRGVLYAGLMRTSCGLTTLEFNARLGDPETQVLIPLLQSDLYEVLTACAGGTLAAWQQESGGLRWKEGSAVCVVLAADGYPQSPRLGDVIYGLPTAPLEDNPDRLIFHGGTQHNATGDSVTAGGRVLSVIGYGSDRESARQRAYALAQDITFSGKHYRQDIAAAPSLVLS